MRTGRFLAKNDIKQSSEKMVALRMAIQHHVPRFEDKSDRPELIIARHHFPQALLECRVAWKIKAGTTFLSTKQAQLIAERDHFGSAGFKETCNKVSTLLLEKAGRSTFKSSDANKFVQAPVASKIKVEEYVKTWLTPSRLQRRKEKGERRKEKGERRKHWCKKQDKH
jgi:hypothetical protein